MNDKTLSQQINELKKQGYTNDFNLDDDKITDKALDSSYLPDQFNVDKVYRFEGMTNPADNSILYAITTSDGRKGLLVDGYGVSGGQISKQLQEKLNR
ncbi:phosphoribosylpyrophosphate synthetase [Mesohalobacter halotolerans]|jgi:hypothetical protein|uniref:Phosphoribosylpyrophosphate synthetase n=1 Tax=Mesohalobacter halotolerans TaxID=1883405 RepID=A0A4U5TQS5_9FLAO|nr:phosphoribosylpyrophosphate synthetase [Mesohalobacter halotolerans]MBS3738674.1 phosphoribosylpyrophosphate synthetase [Psychroflexus sp.]TKS56570.1 phosphoribosylpyrophosphate synthetase [Mesohalobacter halotolerans]